MDDGVRLVTRNGTTPDARSGGRPIIRLSADIHALVNATQGAIVALPDGPDCFSAPGGWR
jgi:hypothetical protein